VSRNRFAVLDKSRQLYLKTLKNETKRKISIPNVSINYIFSGGIGRLLLRTSDAMLLYDIQSLKVLAEMATQSRHPIKYVHWSPDGAYLALFSKATIYITTARLEEVCTINEQSRIKSGAWDALGVFVYTTATHIKYLLPNGENGILRTLDTPIYLTAASSTSVSFLDRELRAGKLPIDATEYLFKLALLKHKNREVLKIMQSKKLVGESIIAYLHKKGYPEVALHFVEDPQIKFSLALECGNIGVALECATKLDNDECWHKLGVEALRQGNHQVSGEFFSTQWHFLCCSPPVFSIYRTLVPQPLRQRSACAGFLTVPEFLVLFLSLLDASVSLCISLPLALVSDTFYVCALLSSFSGCGGCVPAHEELRALVFLVFDHGQRGETEQDVAHCHFARRHAGTLPQRAVLGQRAGARASAARERPIATGLPHCQDARAGRGS
jgi:hypothetical protein